MNKNDKHREIGSGDHRIIIDDQDELPEEYMKALGVQSKQETQKMTQTPDAREKNRVNDASVAWELAHKADKKRTARLEKAVKNTFKLQDPKEVDYVVDAVNAWNAAHIENDEKNQRARTRKLGFIVGGLLLAGIGLGTGFKAANNYFTSHSKKVAEKHATYTPTPVPCPDEVPAKGYRKVCIEVPEHGKAVVYFSDGAQAGKRVNTDPKGPGEYLLGVVIDGDKTNSVNLNWVTPRPTETPRPKSQSPVPTATQKPLETIAATNTPVATATYTPTPNETQTYGSLQKTLDAMGYPNETTPQMFGTPTYTPTVSLVPSLEEKIMYTPTPQTKQRLIHTFP